MGNLVSIVIPVYNVEKYIHDCVDSVIAQTYHDLEIILVDDGSTDSSGIICDKYKEKDDRIKVFHQKNGGLSAARNTGMDSAIGEYLYFLDSDDYIEPQTIERLVDTIEQEKADIVLFDGYVVYTDCENDGSDEKYCRKKHYKTATGKKFLKELISRDEFRTPVQFFFFSHLWIKKNKLRFYEGIIHEDVLFTLKVFLANGVVAHCNEKLYARRIRPASIMTSSSLERRYRSIMTVFFELSKQYQSDPSDNQMLRTILVEEAKFLLSKFQLLSKEKQAEYIDTYKAFKKAVINLKGFGDIKLLEKCSSGLRRKYYHLKRKVFQ